MGIRNIARRCAVLAVSAMAAASFLFSAGTAAQAQSGEPIKIGFSMALTGPLAANGKQALLGMKIWEEQINKKGGLLGRPVKLVFYDDQSMPSTVPGIYTKLLDVDKVDLVLGPYATAMAAPAMPVIMQKGKVFIILFGLAVNTEFKYPKFFAMIPSGPNTKPSFTEGFFDVAAVQKPKPTTVALVAADQEFSRNACEGARVNAKKHGFKIVYDRTLEVSLLSTPKLLSFADEADLLAQIRAGEDGLILESQGRRGTFLPQVWESIPDTRAFLAELVKKAGLAPDTPLARCRILRYRVVKFDGR